MVWSTCAKNGSRGAQPKSHSLHGDHDWNHGIMEFPELGRDPPGSLSPTPGPAQVNPSNPTLCLGVFSKCFLNLSGLGL